MSLAATSLAAEFGIGVVESERAIHVAADVDGIVVGGTAARRLGKAEDAKRFEARISRKCAHGERHLNRKK